MSVVETAGRHLARRIPTASPEARVADVRASLSGQRWDAVASASASSRRPIGTAPTSFASAFNRQMRIGSLALADTPHVGLLADQEYVASLAIRHGISAVPALDDARRLIGLVPAQALLEVLRHEHIEDLHRLAGIRHEEGWALAARTAGPLRRVWDRLPWLLVGLAGSVLAALLMARFQGLLQARVAVAFFVPGLVYLADAIGTQTEAIAVRGLSLSHEQPGRLLLGELRTGLLLGACLGVVSAAGAWLWLGDARLGLAVGLSLFTASTVASSVGFVFPWLLDRAGRDPAYGSGPIATVIQDVLSLAIYFAMVSWIAV